MGSSKRKNPAKNFATPGAEKQKSTSPGLTVQAMALLTTTSVDGKVKSYHLRKRRDEQKTEKPKRSKRSQSHPKTRQDKVEDPFRKGSEKSTTYPKKAAPVSSTTGHGHREGEKTLVRKGNPTMTLRSSSGRLSCREKTDGSTTSRHQGGSKHSRPTKKRRGSNGCQSYIKMDDDLTVTPRYHGGSKISMHKTYREKTDGLTEAHRQRGAIVLSVPQARKPAEKHGSSKGYMNNIYGYSREILGHLADVQIMQLRSSRGYKRAWSYGSVTARGNGGCAKISKPQANILRSSKASKMVRRQGGGSKEKLTVSKGTQTCSNIAYLGTQSDFKVPKASHVLPVSTASPSTTKAAKFDKFEALPFTANLTSSSECAEKLPTEIGSDLSQELFLLSLELMESRNHQ